MSLMNLVEACVYFLLPDCFPIIYFVAACQFLLYFGRALMAKVAK